MDETAPAGRTRLTAEQRRKSILDAATEVFAAAGYRAGKVSDVAARVGVTEPVIFQNFGSMVWARRETGRLAARAEAAYPGPLE